MNPWLLIYKKSTTLFNVMYTDRNNPTEGLHGCNEYANEQMKGFVF